MEWSSYCTPNSKSDYAFFKYHRFNDAAYKIYTENKSKKPIIKNLPSDEIREKTKFFMSYMR